MVAIERSTFEPDNLMDIVKSSIESILSGEDHREVINKFISTKFLSETTEFFKKVVDAKLRCESIDLEWYKEAFIKNESDKQLVAAYGGLALKSIQNKRKTTRREVVLEESLMNCDTLLSITNDLCNSDIEIELAITFHQVTVNLNLSESLIVINALAIRRNQIRGGNWSAFGKQIEAPLLFAMCILFQVPESNYSKGHRQSLREVDFKLVDREGNEKRCEVKLQGKGNPEGVDTLYARNADVFIAGTLSSTNIEQMESEGVEWVELSKPNGFMRFGDVLENLNVPHEKLNIRDNEIRYLIKKTVSELELEA